MTPFIVLLPQKGMGILAHFDDVAYGRGNALDPPIYTLLLFFWTADAQNGSTENLT